MTENNKAVTGLRLARNKKMQNDDEI